MLQKTTRRIIHFIRRVVLIMSIIKCAIRIPQIVRINTAR